MIHENWVSFICYCKLQDHVHLHYKMSEICTSQKASWTNPPQVFTSVHLFNKIVRSKFTISSPFFLIFFGSRFTTVKIMLGEDHHVHTSSCAPVNTTRLVFTRRVCEFPNAPSVKYETPKQKFLRDLTVTPRIHDKCMNELSHTFTKYLPMQIPLLSV